MKTLFYKMMHIQYFQSFFFTQNQDATTQAVPGIGLQISDTFFRHRVVIIFIVFVRPAFRNNIVLGVVIFGCFAFGKKIVFSDVAELLLRPDPVLVFLLLALALVVLVPGAASVAPVHPEDLSRPRPLGICRVGRSPPPQTPQPPLRGPPRVPVLPCLLLVHPQALEPGQPVPQRLRAASVHPLAPVQRQALQPHHPAQVAHGGGVHGGMAQVERHEARQPRCQGRGAAVGDALVLGEVEAGEELHLGQVGAPAVPDPAPAEFEGFQRGEGGEVAAAVVGDAAGEDIEGAEVGEAAEVEEAVVADVAAVQVERLEGGHGGEVAQARIGDVAVEQGEVGELFELGEVDETRVGDVRVRQVERSETGGNPSGEVGDGPVGDGTGVEVEVLEVGEGGEVRQVLIVDGRIFEVQGAERGDLVLPRCVYNPGTVRHVQGGEPRDRPQRPSQRRAPHPRTPVEIEFLQGGQARNVRRPHVRDLTPCQRQHPQVLRPPLLRAQLVDPRVGQAAAPPERQLPQAHERPERVQPGVGHGVALAQVEPFEVHESREGRDPLVRHPAAPPERQIDESAAPPHVEQPLVRELPAVGEGERPQPGAVPQKEQAAAGHVAAVELRHGEAREGGEAEEAPVREARGGAEVEGAQVGDEGVGRGGAGAALVGAAEDGGEEAGAPAVGGGARTRGRGEVVVGERGYVLLRREVEDRLVVVREGRRRGGVRGRTSLAVAAACFSGAGRAGRWRVSGRAGVGALSGWMCCVRWVWVGHGIVGVGVYVGLDVAVSLVAGHERRHPSVRDTSGVTE
mmetsp:Transcript_864/g.1920  ORF Transcript_864/g.1920 Transcript_864/m.1920 type:complete len:795 (+) Transcript_864:19-2403(+)